MLVNREYLDINVLDEGFTLSRLWLFREDMSKAKYELEELRDLAVKFGDTAKVVDYEKQLQFIIRNLDSVEYVMEQKETEIFLYTQYGDACLN